MSLNAKVMKHEGNTLFAMKEMFRQTKMRASPGKQWYGDSAVLRHQTSSFQCFLQRNLGNSYLQSQAGSGASIAQKKIGIQSPLNQYGVAEDAATVKGISASGAGTVSIKYSPEASDKSNKLVFIQVMRELLDGTPIKPSTAAASFAFQDADTTSDFYHVDYTSGEVDPYYNGDDPADIGTQGNATSTPKVDATMTDTPNYSDAHFPVGKSKLTWEFRTIAFSAAGADKGTYYAYARWTYEKEKGKAATITHQGTSTDTSLSKSRAAITLWASNHGFVMPK